MKLESKIQGEIIRKLNKLPRTYAYKQNPPPKGIPDIHCISCGNPYYFEVKREMSDDARAMQKYRIIQLREAGGVAEVVRSWSDVVGIMDIELVVNCNE